MKKTDIIVDKHRPLHKLVACGGAYRFRLQDGRFRFRGATVTKPRQ